MEQGVIEVEPGFTILHNKIGDVGLLLGSDGTAIIDTPGEYIEMSRADLADLVRLLDDQALRRALGITQ